MNHYIFWETNPSPPLHSPFPPLPRNVHYMSTTYSRYVHDMLTTCSKHFHHMFTTCSQHVHNMVTTCSKHVLLTKGVPIPPPAPSHPLLRNFLLVTALKNPPPPLLLARPLKIFYWTSLICST